MQTDRHGSIKRRLILGFGLLILIFGIYGVYSLYENRTISNLTRTIYNHPLVVSNAALQANVSITKMHRDMKDVVLFESASQIQESIDKVNRQEQIVLNNLDIVRDSILGNEGKQLENETRILFKNWRPIREEVITLVKNGNKSEAAQITIGKGADHVAALEGRMLALTDYARNKASSFMDASQKASSRLNTLSIIFFCLAISLTSLIALFTLKRTRAAENEIRESRQLLLNAIDNAPIGMIMLEPGGKFYKVNESFCAMTGYSEQELLGMNFQDLTYPDDRDLGSRVVKQLTNQELSKAVIEKRYVRKNGEVINVYLTTTLLRDAQGIPLYFFTQAIDITERKQAEQELKSREELLNRIIDESPFATWISDAEGTLQRANPALKRILNLTDEQLVGKYNILKDPLVEQQGLMDSVRSVFEQGRTIHFNIQWSGEDIPALDLKGSNRVYIEAAMFPIRGPDGELSNVVLHWIDITDRKQAEESLIRQQRSIKLSNRIANVFLTLSRDQVFAGVLDVLLKTLDSRFGFFGYINDTGDLVCPSLRCDDRDQNHITEKSIVFPRAGWDGLWGRSLMEKRTLSTNENFHFPEVQMTLENALATPIVYNDNLIGQFVVANKVGGYHKDDRDLLESAAGQTAPVLHAILEEVRRKKTHEKLEDQMRQAQKMEAVGRLAGGVAHDFNNMLGIIIGHADMILEKMGPEQPFYDDLSEIRKAGGRSADLTRQLLAFARKQTIAPKVIDLNRTVEGMLNMLHRLIGEDIDMSWIPGKEVWPVKIDPAQIDQVLVNLCVNAREAISGIGKVTIETHNIAFDEAFCKDHADFLPGEYTLLVVSDNGCGMDSETLSHLFEPFFTTNKSNEGTGLGLATVYGVVKQNNGFINVYSEPDQGATFKIYLPRHGGEEVPLTDKETTHPVARGHETILLVEDEPAILKMTARMLEQGGYKVLAAGTPGEAIDLAREHAVGIHLLITDVVMPEMNGRDLAKNLLSIYPDLKLLFMSGYTANVIAHHGVLDEGVQFIQKPFTSQDLLIKVRETFDEKNP